MLITAKDFIKAIRYRYANDIVFAEKINSQGTSITMFIVSVLENSERRREYKHSHRRWKKKMRHMIRQVKGLTKEMNAEKEANANKE